MGAVTQIMTLRISVGPVTLSHELKHKTGLLLMMEIRRLKSTFEYLPGGATVNERDVDFTFNSLQASSSWDATS